MEKNSISVDEARSLLKQAGLRSTKPRIAVLQILAEATQPLSHSEVLTALGETDWDPATIYRSLIKLRDADLAPVVSRVEGINRYTIALNKDQDHKHPHFVCHDCGRVACLPVTLTEGLGVDDGWMASIRSAMIQINGECPDCLGS